MKFSNFLFILCFLVLTLSFVSAQGGGIQVSVGVTDEGVDIKAPETITFIERERDYNFHVHVLNKSTGFPLTDDTTSCELHLYTPMGEHLLQISMPFDPPLDFDVLIDGGNFTTDGVYSYVATCNDSRVGGFASAAFEVNSTGIEPQIFPYQFFIIILGFLFIVVGVSKDRLRMFKHIGGLIFMVMGVLTLYEGYSFIDWTTLIGKVLGFSLIGLGFYFLIEDAFSRDKQQEYYEQTNKEFKDK